MLIVDTGYLLALLDQRDRHHQRALQFAPTQQQGWITTWPVITETMYFLMERIGIEYAVLMLDDVKAGAIRVWDIPLAQVDQMQRLMRRYKTLPMDLADASLVLLAEHLGSGRILTTDQRDFGAYRWKSRNPFEDVMALS